MNAHGARKHAAIPATDHLLTHAAVDLAAQVHPAPAANHDSHDADDEHRVNPLWMITVGLGGFFALMLLLMTFS